MIVRLPIFYPNDIIDTNLHQAYICPKYCGCGEGYVDAVAFVEVSKKVAGPLTRESFIAAAEKMNTTVRGLTFTCTAENRQAMSQIYLTKIDGSRVVEIQK